MRPKRLLPASLLLLLVASPGRAVPSDPTTYLVKDVDPTVMNLGSVPSPYVSLGNGRSVFLADDPETGRELWGSDGTAAGTMPLLDACVGPCSLQYTFLGQAGGREIFFTSDPTAGAYFGSLWGTGGTRASTLLLADGLQIDSETRPVRVPGVDLLFFVASDGVRGFELWSSDGTAAGTRRVRDLLPGAESPGIRELTAFKGRLYFVAGHRERGPALWTSDGTPAGTRLVRDPWVGRSDHRGPAFLRVAGGSLFFFAPSPGRGQELWTSDGTLRGTRRLTDLPAEDAFWREQLRLPVTAPGGRAAFVADDGEHGLEPWLTDGTPAGTRLLDLCPGVCGSNPALDRVHAGRLYLAADDGRRGREPWVSDGTVAGTRLLRDLCPGSCSSDPGFLGTLGRHLLLTTTRVGVPGTRLFRTDGTLSGTVRIALFTDPLFASLLATGQAGEVNGALLFTGWDPEHGHELWRTDATAAGTRLVADLVGREPASSMPSHLSAAGDRLLFVARTRENNEIRIGFWESDGSAAGTVPRGSDLPLTCFNELYLLAVLPDGDPLFACPETYPTQVLWRGTESGPVRLTPSEVSVFPFAPVAVLGSTVFFTASDPVFGPEPWKTDGTPEGTVRIADLQHGSGSPPYGYTVFQGRVWFTADSSSTGGPALWSTDGSEEGTRPLLPSDTVRHLLLLGVHGGRLWFTARADSGLFGYELWSTDGTAEGTRGFDLVPGPANHAPFRLISAGSRMFFTGSEGGQGLWVSDGTEQGSRRIGPASLRPSFGLEDAVLVDDLLLYRSFEDETLWVSDGTDSGTRLLPGPDSQPIVGAYDLTPFGGQLFFLWREGIWRTDGTAAGTVRVEGDFRSPGELTVVGSRLFFRATDEAHGTELWALE